MPASKQKIKAFTQWTKEQFRLGIDTTNLAFPVDMAAELLRLVKMHKMFVACSDAIALAAKPEKLTKDTKWEDCAPYFLNYLREITGRDGAPLKYIVRANELPDPTPNVNFLDVYIMNAPLTGQAFTIDAAEVHTFIVNSITQNNEAESIIKIFEDKGNRRKDWTILKNHYKGQGIYANNIYKADADIKNLFYGGEKKPHMWWIKFERRLNLTFQTYVKREGRVFHLDEMKLRTFLEKVKCEWLKPIKVTILVRLIEMPVTIPYDQALRAFKSEVNKKFPQTLSTTTPTRRHIQEVSGRLAHFGHGG